MGQFTILLQCFQQDLKKKNTSVAGFFGIDGASASIAYSPLKNISISGSGNYIQSDGFSNFHASINAGAGIYIPIEANAVIELQSTLGLGFFDYADPISGSNYSLTGAGGSYKNWSSALSLTHAPRDKGHIGISIRYGKTLLDYRYAVIERLEESIQSTQQFGYYVYHRSPLGDKRNIYFIGSYGYYGTNEEDQRNIRSISIDLRIGIEFRFGGSS